MAKPKLNLSAPKIDTEIGTRYLAGDELSLDQIRIDGGTQARQALNDATVDAYAQAMEDGAQFPLIIVYHDGESHWLADGFHRLAAARKAGRERLRVEVRMGDKRAAMLHAFGANETHGLRRTNEDKRRAVDAMLKDDEWKTWSNRRIADACAVSLDLVNRVRNAMPHDSTERIVQSSDGRTMNVGGISTANAARERPAKPARLGPGQPEPAPWPAGLVADEGHRIAVVALLGQAQGADERTRSALHQEAYAHARQVSDVTTYNTLMGIMDRAVEGEIAAAPVAPPPPAAPFWQSMTPQHPTAHLWTRVGMNEHHAACGMVSQRLPSGATSAGHCSSCVRATWAAEPKPPDVAPLPALPPRPKEPPRRPREPQSADVSAHQAYRAQTEAYMDQAEAHAHQANAYIAALESLVMAIQRR